jgi:hypothetical protein
MSITSTITVQMISAANPTRTSTLMIGSTMITRTIPIYITDIHTDSNIMRTVSSQCFS